MAIPTMSGSIPWSRFLSLLSTILLLSALALFSLFVYEPVVFPRPGSQFTSLGGSAQRARQLTVWLRPEDHQHRGNKTIHLDWTVTKGLRYPDRVGKWVYLVNGQFPCPNIEARSGDSLVIDLHNHLEDEGLALHFHGLHMQGANHMDSVVGVSQSAITPGGSFTYTFHISPSQAGTFWWHAHSALLRADGLFGALIVYAPVGEGLPGPEAAGRRSAEYENDMLLLVGDWYHLPARQVQDTYDTWSNWGMEPSPDSLLINGRGAFNCSNLPKGRPYDCMSVSRPELVPRASRSRVRVINVGAMSGISIRMAGKRMTVLAVDGGNLVEEQEQQWSAVGVLHPSERVDLVVDWDAPDEAAADYFEIALDREYYRQKNLALATEQTFPMKPNRRVVRRKSTYKTGLLHGPDEFDLARTRGQTYPQGSLGQTSPDQIVLVYTKIELLAHLENRPKGYINHTYWIPQDKPLIDVPRSEWDEHQLVPFVEMLEGRDTWVDIVITNVDEMGHPFHLHGYDFYVLASYYPPHRLGWHAYNPYDQGRKPLGGPYNLVNPIKKDTVYVPAAGYVVLRIKADNPGLWLLHCHVLWHQGVGMAMTLEIGRKGNPVPGDSI